MKLIEKRIIHLQEKSLDLEIKMKARYDELVDFVCKNNNFKIQFDAKITLK